MAMISLLDNSQHELSDEQFNALRSYANKPLKNLKNDNPGLLVFPDCLGEYGDNWKEEVLYYFQGNELHAGNVVGFFGVNGEQVQIRSRFDDAEKKQYFLHYMLCKVFGINLLSWQATSSDDTIWDFLPFLFPYFLKRALKQGVFRTYQKFRYNDDHVRGTIDIARHIRYNMPFNGKIAYQTREYTGHNFLIALIRHAIEIIRRKPMFSGILHNDHETCMAVQQIIELTQNYNRSDLPKVVAKTLRPVRHPFYTEYTELQKICLQIIRHEKISYGEDSPKINGVVFKAEWLWEEYLATLVNGLNLEFTHASNTERKNRLYLYQENKREVYPDFYNNEHILDAKYKHLEDNISREDRFQMISYIHIQKAKGAILLYPKNGDSAYVEDGTLRGYGGTIGKLSFSVPQSENIENFSLYKIEMEKSEESFKYKVKDALSKMQ